MRSHKGACINLCTFCTNNANLLTTCTNMMFVHVVTCTTGRKMASSYSSTAGASVISRSQSLSREPTANGSVSVLSVCEKSGANKKVTWENMYNTLRCFNVCAQER